MSIIIGSARIDEDGHISGGSAGDQTGKEVSTQDFYMHSKGWYALRPKAAKAAKLIAQAMSDACANNKIGYDQGNRYGVVKLVKGGTSIADIDEKTETDCSALVRACVLQATGVDVGDFSTANEVSVLEATDLFEDHFAVSSSSDVYNGDVLVTKKKGHTVVVVSGRSRESSDGGSTYMFEVDTVKSGSKGNDVKLLQRLLKSNGCKGEDGKSLTIDGKCGSNTSYAIGVYQEKKGLTVDNSCGPKTWASILLR